MREAETVTCSVSCAWAGPKSAGAQDKIAATLVMVRALLRTPRRCHLLDALLHCLTSVMTAFPLLGRGATPPLCRLVGGIFSSGGWRVA